MPDKLTLFDAENLASVIEAPAHNSRVTRQIKATGEFLEGTAVSIGTNTGMCDFDNDIRDQYLRVIPDTGLEFFWSIRELMAEIPSGHFIVNHSS